MKIIYSEEVLNALNNNFPVVALESTIITHGMPYPANVSTAKLVEKEVRDHGAIPATIMFIDGDCHIGVNDEQLEYIAKSKNTVKISRRDIPVVCAKKMSGGTTVAATMIMAEKAGIHVFATGGIGGVHREANKNFDISADLDELGKTNVAVICAGPKAILDIPLTLEYLETKGVAVLGYNTDSLPLFYTKESEYKVDYNIKTAKEFAMIMNEKWSNNIEGGLLIANPIPDQFSLDPVWIDDIIEQAIEEAHIKNISGKNITPFLLGRLGELTNNKTLDSNIQLVLNNARLAAEIAKEYAKL